MSSIDEVLQELARRLGIRERPLVFFDLETTGTSTEEDRICQIGFAQIALEGPAAGVMRKAVLVNPTVPIPASASEVHHITDEMVAGAPTFAQISKALLARFQQAAVVSGFNVGRFDLPMLQAEFARCSIAFDPEALCVVDAIGIFHRREPRDLAAALAFYCDGAKHDGAGAHDAGADVDATARVLLGQLQRYQDLPTSPADLAEYSANRPPDALDGGGQVVWRDGCARLSFGKHAGKPLKDVDAGYFRWALGQSFPSSTHAIFRAALAGQFPTGPRQAK